MPDLFFLLVPERDQGQCCGWVSVGYQAGGFFFPVALRITIFLLRCVFEFSTSEIADLKALKKPRAVHNLFHSGRVV